jgi:hypothetical protein
MAVGFPTKVSYLDGDVFSASDINDTNGTLNLLNPTAKGSIVSASAANTPSRLAVGTNGYVLMADSTAATGLKWGINALGNSTVAATVTNPAGTAFASSAGTDPAVTLTTGTTALVYITARVLSGGNYNWVSFKVTGATTMAAADAISLGGTPTQFQGTALYYVSGLTAGSNTFTMQYRSNVSASGSYDNRSLTVVALP